MNVAVRVTRRPIIASHFHVRSRLTFIGDSGRGAPTSPAGMKHRRNQRSG